MDPVVHRCQEETPASLGRRQMLDDLSQSVVPLGEQLYSVLRWLAANKYVKKTGLEGWLGILQGHLAEAKRVQLKLRSDLTLDDTDIRVADAAAKYFAGQVSLVKHKLIASMKAEGSGAQVGLETPNLGGFTVKALLDVTSFCMREDVCVDSECRDRLAIYCATSGGLAIPQGDSNPNLNTELRTILTEMVAAH